MKRLVRGSSIIVQDRPYVMAINRPATLADPKRGTAFPLSSDEVRNLIAHATIQSAYVNRLIMTDGNGTRVTVYPATLGGGQAFTF